MNAGTAIAIVLGPLLYRWLATHEGFTLALVKLEAEIVFGLFIAIGFHIAGMVAGHEPSWAADEQVVIFSAVAFIGLWEWRSARRPAVKHYDVDEIEILPPDRPAKTHRRPVSRVRRFWLAHGHGEQRPSAGLPKSANRFRFHKAEARQMIEWTFFGDGLYPDFWFGIDQPSYFLFQDAPIFDDQYRITA